MARRHKKYRAYRTSKHPLATMQVVWNKYKENYKDVVQLTIDLCKGRVSEYTSEGNWFYKLIVNKSAVNNKTPHWNVPETIQGVKEALQNAWWIEDEDLRQDIFYLTTKYGLIKRTDILFYLLYHMRDNLIITHKVFHQSARLDEVWQSEYSIHLTDLLSDQENPEWRTDDTDFLFKDNKYPQLSLFDRYIIYLFCLVPYPGEASKILDLTPLRVLLVRAKTTKKLEDIYGKNAIRYR